ncbi:MAG: hypothetical protein A2817_01955 [Candidatus Yanofskybacteria bacterium RIFCSPHIGHO2_01_FULL_39_8b]|uniref:DUF8128 domain-containing protein n=1 Tax=Candidatus Yanofskybacteria bacterium RIFCSPHIGHO2_01_FULL_39_8b TaxID=1802659 RepID=A0A1F8E7X9_9BACT|nr:MAG: hypothetical protein A2817_01955 [Candidatus Yanofskybacteria bacterium RIFCSPHIGHO2_01_FULL_39_8b]
MPVFLFFFALTTYKNFIQLRYKLSLKWILLEIRAPKEVRKSPKAMEQVLAGLHGVYSSALNFKDKYIDGRVYNWYSFEIVGKGGETHFYIRTIDKFKNLVEAQLYAQYPDAEISEVSDYVNDMPLHLPDDKYDLWGTDLMLAKPDVFPIRTYPEFEEKAVGAEDVKRVDPLASLSEICSMLHTNEQIWIQILGAPINSDWVKKGQAEIDKIMGKIPAPSKSNFLSDAVFAIDRAINGTSAVVEKREEKRADLSPGKQEILKAVEKSWDKLGYEVIIRYLYIGPRDDFHSAHAYAVSGSFRQFASQNLNSFKMNKLILTYANGLFKKSKLLKRKKIIYQLYRERKLFSPYLARYTLNTEELATIFHFPDTGVKSPLLPRVEAKKGEPPAGLPIT